MAENKPEKKKLGIAFFIFGCVGIVILVGFLLCGVIFNLLSIIGIIMIGLLALSTILDLVLNYTRLEKYKKRYGRISSVLWVFFLGFLAFNFFLPDREKWRTFTFDAELAAIEAKRAILDNQNAAILYNSLFSDIDLNDQPQLFKDSKCSSPDSIKIPWKDSEYPDVAKYLDNHTDMLERLINICQLNLCRFPIDAGPFAYDGDRCKKFRFCANLLWSAANRDAGKGQIKPAFETYLRLLQMAKHFYQQPTMIDFYMGASFENKTLKLLDRLIILENIEDEKLSLIQKALNTTDDWGKDWPAILEVEKLREKNLYGKAYEINPAGKVRFRRNYSFKGETPFLSRYFNNKILSVGISMAVPYSPQSVSRTVDKAYENYKDFALPGFDWSKADEYEKKKIKILKSGLRAMGSFYFFGPFDSSTIEKLHNGYMNILSAKRACCIIAGLKVYRNKNNVWPEKLEDIKSLVMPEAFTDPINKGTFVYKITGDGFTFYSKGKNNIDEDGRKDSEENGADDILIWPVKNN